MLHNLRGHRQDTMVSAQIQPDLGKLVADLFEEHHASVFAYLYRLVEDAEWAHDLCQEAFLRLFRARRQLPQVQNQRAWIYRIATNVAFNALKRRRRFAWLPWQSDGVVDLVSPDHSEQATHRLAVERALAELPTQYRAPLLLYSHYGFSIREVAEALSISEGAVKTRLCRAREMFRQAYMRGEQT